MRVSDSETWNNEYFKRIEFVASKTGLKKLFVCRHPTDPVLEVPTQNILLDF